MTDVMTQTPPALLGPSAKERKYDRQLRLWAATGQAALESANLLLVNSGSGTVGVETLKNLVLPGIGKFTIADTSVVTHADLGVNFFLDAASLGKSRALCCKEFLIELNPEVEASSWPAGEGTTDFGEFLETTEPFTVILYTFPIDPERLRIIKDYGERHQTPLVAVHSAGFNSYFTVSLPGAFPIVDTHPDAATMTDLRLLAPWPALVEFTDRMTESICQMDHHEHSHLPLVVILLYYLNKWKMTHEGDYPTSYADKQAFRKMVSDAMRRDNAEGGEENFEEAAAAVMKHVIKPGISRSLQEVFSYRKRRTGDPTSGFWLIAEAVERFYEDHQVLPVPGGLPDMKAESKVYIQLQNLYKAKARQDAEDVLNAVRTLAGGEAVELEEVELFCTNARFIKLINGANEPVPNLAQIVVRELCADEGAVSSLIASYLALRATSHTGVATATEILAVVAEQVPQAVESQHVQRAAEEVERAAGGELHNVSSTVGGMVAQELIKIITKQYVPIDNTCVFDGITSRCQVLRL